MRKRIGTDPDAITLEPVEGPVDLDPGLSVSMSELGFVHKKSIAQNHASLMYRPPMLPTPLAVKVAEFC